MLGVAVLEGEDAMLTRRDYLALTTTATAALALPPRWLQAAEGSVITRTIPRTEEALPIIGCGSSATFSQVAGRDDVEAVRSVFKAMVDNGGSVFDTAPGYGASEEVAGRVVQDLGFESRVFWATKLNVAGWGGGSADPAAARRQLATSLARLGKDKIDLIQVHNVAALAAQYPILEDYKAQGKVRYIGATSTAKQQYGTLESFMNQRSPDFIGIDYAVDNLSAEERILPLAQDKGIGVLVYMPFGRTRLWDRVKGHDVPTWAQDFGAETWAQFFLKFAAAHPAVTVVTPATSAAAHMIDNMGAARGRLPDPDERKKMAQLIDALPA
jgi:aryl-alcohol dehydrogenase-like predicted oxidoreductase